MAVKVAALTKIYGEQKAVDAISFGAAEGEIVGFLGPNGAGKSTTMKMLTGFVPPTAGSATICGFDVARQSMDVRRKVGYLPEHNPLYLDLYVREYLQFVAGIYGLRRKAGKHIDRVIAQTGLGLEQKKKIGQLSKGYRQRVGLAQALLHDPAVLILDEPTSGLDPNQLSDIRQLIQQIGQEKTVLFSTHILQEVQAICDRVVIISQGKLVADDTVAQLTSALLGQEVIDVAFKHPVADEKLTALAGVNTVNKMGPAQYQLLVSDRDDIREQIFAVAVAANNPILTLKRSSRDLAAVFRSLTQQQEGTV